MGSQLGLPSDSLNPFDNEEIIAAPEGRCIDCVSERIAFTPALGLAMSDNKKTPNIIYTYEHEEEEVATKKYLYIFMAVFLIATTFLMSIFGYQIYSLVQKKIVINRLDDELAAFSPRLDKKYILDIATKVRSGTGQFSPKAFRNRYQGAAIISELSAITPAHVKFINFKLILKSAVGSTKIDSSGKSGKEKEDASQETGLEIEGLVKGEQMILESRLAEFVTILQGSSMFKQVTIKKHAIESLKDEKTLHFLMHCKIG